MKPSETVIKNEIKRLRRIIDTSTDPIEARIAYIKENTLRWATEDTTGWPKPSSKTELEGDVEHVTQSIMSKAGN